MRRLNYLHAVAVKPGLAGIVDLDDVAGFHVRNGKAVADEQAARLHANSLRELMRCHESKDILAVSELAIQATMQRKESGRCVYRLADYPSLNPDMGKPLLVLRQAGGPRFQWGKAPLL